MRDCAGTLLDVCRREGWGLAVESLGERAGSDVEMGRGWSSGLIDST